MKKAFRIILPVIALTICLLFVASCGGGGTTGGDNGASDGVRLTEDMVTLKFDSVNYIGEPIVFDDSAFEIIVNGTAANLRDFSFAYRDNVNAGTATVTVTAVTSDLAYGSVDKHFTILPGSTTAYSLEEAKSALNNANFALVTLSAVTTIAEGETFVIPEGKSLQANLGIDNYGEIKALGDFGLYTNVKLNNYGKLTVEGKLALSNGAAIYNIASGNLRGKIVNNGTLYFNGEAPSGIEGNGNVVVRRPLEEAEVTLENEQVRYVKGENGFLPGKITVKPPKGTASDGSKYSPVYSDNDYIGTAYVTLTAPIDDGYFYGEKAVEYEIIPAAVTVSNEDALNEAFADKEVNYVTYRQSIYKYTGSFTVPEGYTLDMGAGDTVHLSAEDITVNGTLLAANLNAGTLTVPEGGTITVARDMTVRETLKNDGTIIYNGGEYDEMALCGTVENGGNIVNKGVAYYESETPFDITGFDNTDGKLYSYCALDGLVNVTVKHDISDPEVMWLSYQTTPYNAEEQKPYIRSDLGILYTNQYRVTYLRNGAETDDKKSVGTVTMKIEIVYRTENAFRGTALLDYEITRSETTVIINDALVAAAKDHNYYGVKLGCDLDPSSVTVAEGVELDLNGYKLDVSDLKNYGRLVIPANDFTEGYTPGSDDCNLYFCSIDNYGYIENNGLMASSPGTNNCYFNNAEGSEFINNGSVTVDEAMLDGATPSSGTGTMIGRKYYEDLAFALTETEFYYDETAKEPDFTVTLKKDGSPVDKSIFTRKYVSNLYAGTGKLYLYDDNADIYSEFYITSSNVVSNDLMLPFTIYRSEIEVATSEELLNAATDANYERITLKGDIALGANALTLNENVILDCGSYLLTTDGTVAPSVPATSAITAEVSDIDSFNTMKYIATDVKLLRDIGNNTETVAFDAVNYSVDLDVDLNGYNLRAAVRIGNNTTNKALLVKTRFYDGSEAKTGKISGLTLTDSEIYAIFTGRSDGGSNVELILEDITVNGLDMGSGDGNTCSITVNRCNIFGANESSRAVSTDSAKYNIGLSSAFTDCVIEGYSAININSRETSCTFDNCTIKGTGTYIAPSGTYDAGKGYGVAVYFNYATKPVFNNCNIESVNGIAIVQTQYSSSKDYSGICSVNVNGGTLKGAQGAYREYTAGSIKLQGTTVIG